MGDGVRRRRWCWLLAWASVAHAALTLSEPQPLAGGLNSVSSPAISPDGTRLAFISDRDGSDNLFVMPLAGGAPTKLTRESRPGVQLSNPRWSPRGDLLVYCATRDGAMHLNLVTVDGQRQEPLTQGDSTDWMPSWSPDGSAIAFVSDRENRTSEAIYSVSVDGGNLRKLVDAAYEPSFSPDGRRLAAFHVDGARSGLFVFDRDGRNGALVLDGGRMACWSPDGRWLLAVKPGAAGSQLWLVDADKGTAEPLGSPLPGLAWPTWGTRGNQIAFEARPGGRKQVLVATLAAGQPLAALTEPVSGTTVRGAVTVRGRLGATGATVANWRLEVGAGAAPVAWTLLAEGHGPQEGALATWNSAGTDGTATLRLTAVSDGGETAVASALVSVVGQYAAVWETNTLPPTLLAGETLQTDISVRNNGTMTWRNDGPFAVTAGYQWLDEAGAPVLSESQAAALVQAVPAGESTLLKATITAPKAPGKYTLRFDLRQGGQLWFRDQGARALERSVQVTLPYAAQIDVPSVPAVMVPGQIYALELKLANKGSATWEGIDGGRAIGPDTVQVTTRWRDAAGGLVDTPPLVSALSQTVPPGQTLNFVAQVQAPSVAGRYVLTFELRTAAGAFVKRPGEVVPTVPVTVLSPFGVQFGEHNTPGRVFSGDVVTVNLQARNTGSLTWPAGGVGAVTVVYTWLTKDGRVVERNGLRTPLPYDVAPGQTAAFSARVQSAADPGEYVLIWDLEQAGGKRFADLGNVPLKVPVMIGAPTHSVRWEQTRHPVEMVVGSTYTVELKLVNTGSMTWPAQGNDRVRVAYHWVRPGGEEVNANPVFTDFEKSLDAGDAARLTARVKAPDKPGRYMLRWDLYQGGYDYFSTRGAATLDVPVAVNTVYGAKFESHDTPAKLVAGQRYKVNLRLRNLGAIPWDPSGPVPVTLVYRWYDAQGNEAVATELVSTRLPQIIQPGESLDLAAFLVAPKERGRYDLQWDLQFAGTFLFSEKGVEPLRLAVVVE